MEINGRQFRIKWNAYADGDQVVSGVNFVQNNGAGVVIEFRRARVAHKLNLIRAGESHSRLNLLHSKASRCCPWWQNRDCCRFQSGHQMCSQVFIIMTLMDPVTMTTRSIPAATRWSRESSIMDFHRLPETFGA